MPRGQVWLCGCKQTKGQQIHLAAASLSSCRANQQDSKADAEAEHPDTAAAVGMGAADAAEQPAAAAVPCLSAEASTQTADQEGAAASSLARIQAAADGDALPHAEASHDQECKTPRAAGCGSGELQVAAPASHTPGSKRRRHVQGGREGTPPHMVADRPQPMSPFRQLKVQTHALRAEPHNAQVAIEQRTLLQQQILTMGLQMQQRDLEKQLALVKQKLKEVQTGRDIGSADVMSRLGSPAHPDQCCSPQLEHVDSPVHLAVHAKQSRLGPGGSSSPSQVAARQAWLAGGGSADFIQQMEPMQALPAGAQDSPIVQQQQDGTAAAGPDQHSRSASSSAASTPRSSGASTSGDSCAELLDELSELAEAVQKAAVASHQASTFKAVSASTLSPVRRSQQQLLLTSAADRADVPAALLRSIDGSIAVSSVGSPAGFPPQQQQQQQLCGSPDKLAGALLDAATALDADATVKLQADLQVSSAYELAAARGFLHFEASLQELRSTLAGSKQDPLKQKQQTQGAVTTAGKQQSAQKGSRQSAAHNSPSSSQHGGKLQAQRQGQESPPVVRTLFSNYEGADAAGPKASLEAAVAAAAVAKQGSVGAAAFGCSPGPQQQGFSMLRQLQQQQQYIIEVLGNLSAVQHQQGAVAGGSPTLTNPLQQLLEAQQQLQVLLHAVGAVIQDAHANLADGSAAGGDGRQLIALVGPGGLQGVSPGSRQGSGAWAGSFIGDAGPAGTPDSSPARQQRKLAGQQQQLLQGSSPDQQLQRDSSPDKLRRSQRAWLQLPRSPCLTSQQQLGTADGTDSGVAARLGMQLPWPAEEVAGHAQQQQDSQHSQQEAKQQVQELTQLRGQVLRLQLELQRAKQQAQAAECLISSCTSLGGRRSTSPDAAWIRRSQDSVSTPAAAASGASGSSAGTPTQLVLLSGRNKELQAQCMQRDNQVRQLEIEVRRLQNELRQQALAAAVPAGAPGAGGSLTPRGVATPRHGLGSVAGPGPSLFSPQRRAVSSPGATGTPRSFSSSGAVALGLPATVPSPALSGLAAPHASHVPTTRFASACGSQGGYSESHVQPSQAQLYGQLPAVSECAQPGCRQQDQQQRDLAAYSTAVVRASLDEVSCASTSSSRSRGKGIRVGSGKPPLAVPALKRKQ